MAKKENMIAANKKISGTVAIALLAFLFVGMDFTAGIISGLANIHPALNIVLGVILGYVAYLFWTAKRIQ